MANLHGIENLPENTILFPRMIRTHQLLLGPFNGCSRPGIESHRIKENCFLVIAQQVDTEISAQQEALPWIRSISDDVSQADILLDTQGSTIFENSLECWQVGMNVADNRSLQLRPPDSLDNGGFGNSGSLFPRPKNRLSSIRGHLNIEIASIPILEGIFHGPIPLDQCMMLTGTGADSSEGERSVRFLAR